MLLSDLLNRYNLSENPLLCSLIPVTIQIQSIPVFYGWLTIKNRGFILVATVLSVINSIQEAIII